MMNATQLIQSALDQLVELPDQKGITRCASFCELYQTLYSLKKQIVIDREFYESQLKKYASMDERKDDQNG